MNPVRKNSLSVVLLLCLAAPALAQRSPVIAPEPDTDIPQRTWLGVFTQALPADSPQQGKGVLVRRVYDNSPASSAGLRRDDVIAGFDRQPVKSVNQLVTMIQKKPAGKSVKLRVLRENKPITLTAKLMLCPSELAAIPSRTVPLREHAQKMGTNRLTIRPGNSAPEVKGEEPLSRPVSLVLMTCTPEGGWTLKYQMAPNGEQFVQFPPNEKNFTRAELEKALTQLEEDNQKEQLLKVLQEAREIRSKTCTCRFNMKPRLHGSRILMQVMLTRGCENQPFRCYFLQHLFPADKQAQVDDLLKIKSFSEELAGLPPSVRKSIEQTLRRMKLPRIQTRVQKVQ